MQFSIIQIAALASIFSIGASANATLDYYTDTACTQGESQSMASNGGCDKINPGYYGVTQNIGDDGIKYTCNAYSDSDCKNRIAEIYHCSGSNGSPQVGSINCYENPPL
ncbi:hypothetical protein M409DRAFT_58930 [Zasmidium cellare ATCC 36951]|uniref:Uncharacterized protein n=1 Tax=Zasmidium cellare ATCC 36951 TaxID=1080233 RepID=A0A6A6C3D5_ZASCE|nr:uncharacterized protein M409DRAFT_58930 [Zasmidium cellare ATCC 36951]KAF2161525.1 hypothetical protein M409DRAFT_58930 [Zasmidium cellare ATCC 36951]